MSASDIGLLERWAGQRDAEAFAELVARHSPMVYGTCRRILQNDADAEDVAQECFLELLRLAAASRRIKSSLGGWLHTTATHRSLDRLKAEKRRRLRDGRLPRATTSLPEAGDLDDVQWYVDEAINRLPEKLREPFVCHFLEGRSHQSIARMLGIPRTTVTSRIAKGIEEVRNSLKRRGVPITASVLASVLTVESSEAAPPALTAALNKIALAGGGAIASATLTGGSTGTSVLAITGGIAGMKTFATAAIIAGVVAAVVLAVRLGGEEEGNLERVRGPARMAITAEPKKDSAPRKVAVAHRNVAPQTTPAVSVHTGAAGTRVTGTVVDSQGNPIEGATVTLHKEWPSDPSGVAHTERDGAFKFNLLTPSRSVHVRAEKDGMLRMPSSGSEFTESGFQDIVITLYRVASIEGIVVDPWGRPVPSKDVTGRWLGLKKALITDSVVTNTGGEFLITGLLPGTHALTVIPKESYRTDMEDVHIELEEGERRLGIRIVYDGDGLVVAGRVTNETDEPVKAALVQVLMEHTASAHTDEEGRYRITRLPEGVYMMMVNHRDYESQLVPSIETGREDVDFVLVTLPAEGVTGRVIDEITRLPITDFDIAVRNGFWPGPYWGDRFKNFHDEQGRFLLKEVGAREATIVAQASGYAPGYAGVRVVEGEKVPEVIIALSKGHVLEGTVVTPSGEGVPDAYIFVDETPVFHVYEDKGDFELFVEDSTVIRSEADGSFVVAGLERERRTVILAYHFEYGLGFLELTPSGPETTGAEVVLELSGQITGTVTLAGEPLPDAKVWAYHEGLDLPVGEAETEADGSCVLTDVPEGHVEVGFAFPGSLAPHLYRSVHHYNVAVENGRTTQVLVDYPPGNSKVEGNVTIFSEPVQRGDVSLRMITSAGTERTRRSLGINGRYVFWDVPAGPASLCVRLMDESGDWLTRTINFEIPEAETIRMDIDLSGNSAVGGQVAGLGPFRSGSVTALAGEVAVPEFSAATFVELQPLSQGQDQIAYDGTYRIQGLEPGVYTFLAFVAPHGLHGNDLDQARFGTAVVNLQENEEVDLDFDLR